MTHFVARPTVYNGIRMRSRLEATFAAFLDHAGFEWAYEPRAYGTGAGQYLPDFEVTFTDVDPIYFEIKGSVRALTHVQRVGLLRRMEIIHASEPHARLALLEAEYFARGHYEFPFNDPQFPRAGPIQPWRFGRFAACGCGSVRVGVVEGEYVENTPIWRPVEACGRCEHDDILAWLDPIRARR